MRKNSSIIFEKNCGYACLEFGIITTNVFIGGILFSEREVVIQKNVWTLKQIPFKMEKYNLA